MTEGSLSDKKPIKILLTGFGPFRTYTKNASYEIIKDLPEKIRMDEGTEAGGEELEIIVYPEPIRVNYSTVGKVMKEIYTSNEEEELDFVIHLGVSGRLERAHFLIENIAHRTGFVSPDVDGLVCEDVAQNPLWPRSLVAPASLHTSLDTDHLIHLVKCQNIDPAIDLQTSEDAGRFLCEFTYYTSLLNYYEKWESKKQDEKPPQLNQTKEEEEKEEENEETKPTKLPVIFLHVPVFLEESDLALARNLLLFILKSLPNLPSIDPLLSQEKASL